MIFSRKCLCMNGHYPDITQRHNSSVSSTGLHSLATFSPAIINIATGPRNQLAQLWRHGLLSLSNVCITGFCRLQLSVIKRSKGINRLVHFFALFLQTNELSSTASVQSAGTAAHLVAFICSALELVWCISCLVQVAVKLSISFLACMSGNRLGYLSTCLVCFSQA